MTLPFPERRVSERAGAHQSIDSSKFISLFASVPACWNMSACVTLDWGRARATCTAIKTKGAARPTECITPARPPGQRANKWYGCAIWAMRPEKAGQLIEWKERCASVWRNADGGAAGDFESVKEPRTEGGRFLQQVEPALWFIYSILSPIPRAAKLEKK